MKGYGHLKISETEGVKRGHLLGLYLTPKVTGQSIGRTIVALMMEQLQSANVKTVTLAATLTARDFYRKMGFIENGPETTIRIGGAPIRCFPMKMEL